MNMKLNTLTKLMKWFSAISLACAATSLVGVPVDIDYNGSLADDSGSLLDGDYFFKFAIAPEAPADASEIYWSNAPWDAGTSMPDAALTVTVTAGTFSVLLEDVDSTVLGNPDLTLHVWISDAADGTFEYLGANPINSVPYAVVAGTAETIAGDGIVGEIDGNLIAAGTLNADKLGTIVIDVPFIDANEDGTPGDTDVSMATILESISKNSALTFNDVNANRDNYEVFLEEGQPVGSIEGWIGGAPTSGEFKDPFPIGQVYEYNGGLMPILSIIDENGNDITGTAGTPIPGLTFVWVTNQDVEGTSAGSGINDGLNEGRMVVRGTPTTSGDYTVRVKAKNRWGQAFVQEYSVYVRNVDIDATVFAERIPEGGSSYTTSGANDPYGANPVRFRFTVEDLNGNPTTLDPDVVVRWTVPLPGGGMGTTDILGDTGRTFYVNSPDGPIAGTGSSLGVIELDENPLAADISHVGTYSATILFDWGQGVNVGSDSIDSVQEGFVYGDFTAIRYDAPDGLGLTNLFDQFTHSGAYPIGDELPNPQYFGASPAGDEAGWNFESTIEAGETQKNLIGENPFAVQVGEGIAGVMENRWIQQKVERYWDGNSWETRIVGVRDLNRTISTDGVNDPTVRLDLDGFGPMPADANWPLSTGGGAGVIADDNFTRGDFAYPQDGGMFSYHSVGRLRPGGSFGGNADLRTQNAWNYLVNMEGDLFITYWLYATNGYIDSLAPITAIIEVGENINVANDLLDITQVAGYSAQIGGDFGTTNGEFTSVLYPDSADGELVAAPGVNDVAYVWNTVGNTSGISFVDAALGNSVIIPGRIVQNIVNADEDINNIPLVDFSYTLDIDSGYSSEQTSADVYVRSDIVVYDFYVEEIDLSLNPTDPGFVLQGGPGTTDITIDQGDDLRFTMSVYIRPSIFNSEDDGGIDNGITNGLMRDLFAKFFLFPSLTGSAAKIEITNNITRTDDDTIGLDADDDDNHVPGPIQNRVLVTWEVILENPLQDIAQTNTATGYVSAALWTVVDGAIVNKVTTQNTTLENAVGTLDFDPISGYANGFNAIDGTLDTAIQMPLSPTLGGGPGDGVTITVNP